MGIAFKGLSLGKALGQVVPVAAERLGSACCRISSNMCVRITKAKLLQ